MEHLVDDKSPIKGFGNTTVSSVLTVSVKVSQMKQSTKSGSIIKKRRLGRCNHARFTTKHVNDKQKRMWKFVYSKKKETDWVS